MSKRNVLIVGGTSGLGLELAKQLSKKDNHVTVTGNNGENVPVDISFYRLNLTEEILLPNNSFHDVIFAAGFSQVGHISDLTEIDIDKMTAVCFTSYIKVIKNLLSFQNALDRVAYISSTSGYIPRELEPVYSSAKAGAMMFSKAFAKDVQHVNKVLVFAPSGMKTSFWREDPEKDVEGFMDPELVAEEIIGLMEDSTSRYIEWKILGDQNHHHRLEVVNSF